MADNCGGSDVEEYAKGSTTMTTSITNGISNPLGLTIDKNGTLYVSNYPASITEYAFGTTTPSKTITGGGLTDPFGLAADTSGNVYIADFGADAVFKLAAGGSSVTNLGLTGLGEPIGLAIDNKHHYLWETDGSGNLINVYKLGGSTSPIHTIPGNEYPIRDQPAERRQAEGRGRRIGRRHARHLRLQARTVYVVRDADQRSGASDGSSDNEALELQHCCYERARSGGLVSFRATSDRCSGRMRPQSAKKTCMRANPFGWPSCCWRCCSLAGTPWPTTRTWPYEAARHSDAKVERDDAGPARSRFAEVSRSRGARSRGRRSRVAPSGEPEATGRT